MTAFLPALLASLFFPGIITRVKSLLSGRKGPGILQPWKNLLVLVRKGSVISPTTGLLFRLAPVVYFVTIICALILVPFPGAHSVVGFKGDFVFLAYLLALGKLLFILGALDTGSSFEGMGANREALYSLLAEPAFFILFGTLALFTGFGSLQEIFGHLPWGGYTSAILIVMTVYVLIQVAMIENSRMPVDDPKTHLELTMVHEVMILDHSGFDLVLIHAGTYLKFTLYGSLIAGCLIPPSFTWPVRLLLYVAVQLLFAMVIGALESFRARKKMSKNPQFILTLSSIALVAFVLVVLITFHKLG